jgi:hypothetical protein
MLTRKDKEEKLYLSPLGQGHKKSSSDSQKSLNISRCDNKAFNLTYLSRYIQRDGVGTLPRFRGTGCQGFFGPFPSAFLDKRCIRTAAKI